MLTPLRFLQQYRQITVSAPLDDETQRVCRVAQHRIQLRKYFMMNWTDGTEQRRDYNHTTRGSRNNEWFQQNKERIRNAGMGKGAPQDYALAMEWAVRSGKVANPTAAALQQYMDDRLGIDCSGFVTNYLVAKGKKVYSANTVRNTGAASYYQVNRAVNDPLDVRQGDVLVWMRGGRVLTGPGHVALVESYRPISTADGNMRVVEATGNRNANPRVLDSMYSVTRIIDPNDAQLRNRVMILEVRRHGSTSKVAVMRF
jgi:hypothetical protein